jgi:hypothetical protein
MTKSGPIRHGVPGRQLLHHVQGHDLIALAGGPVSAQGHVLRACADPNDLPFSNDREQGFENRIARLIAADLGMELQYAWWAAPRLHPEHAGSGSM